MEGLERIQRREFSHPGGGRLLHVDATGTEGI